MKKVFVFLAAALLQAGAWAATYTFTGPNYSAADITNFTNCTTGNCGAYTTAMARSGSITTAAPLPNNLNSQDIAGLVTSFSFFDGLTTYDSSDPQVNMTNVTATTTGGTISISLSLQRWQTPAPHALGDHLDHMSVRNTGGSHNSVCTVAPATDLLGQFFCPTSGAGNVYSSWLNSAPGGSWSVTGLPPAATNAVPTLGEWGLLLMASLMLGVGWMTMGRRRM